MKRTRRKLSIIAILIGVVVVLGGCHRTPAEAQIRASIQATAEAAEHLDAGSIDDGLSEDFDGNGGELDRRRLAGMIHLYRLRGEKVSVLVGPIDVQPRGKRLVATFTATLGGGGGLLPEHLGVYQVETAWREDAGEWRCYSATWTKQI